jgi:hypothetical protein
MPQKSCIRKEQRMSFVDFASATFGPVQPSRHESPRDTLLASLLSRPALFQRNQVRWIAACAWRTQLKPQGLSALKTAKQELNPCLIAEGAAAIVRLIHGIYGPKSVDAITCIPCGHSRRPDCFGKQLAQSAALAMGLPFLQVFADRPCSGASHPRQSIALPPLRQIADPPRSMILIDDLATSGRHVEESMLALRGLGVAVSSLVWISGSTSRGTALPAGPEAPDTCPPLRFVIPPRSPFFQLSLGPRRSWRAQRRHG